MNIDASQKVTLVGDLDVAGDMSLAANIIHTGDTDTIIGLDTNTINFTTGNVAGMSMVSGVNYMAGSPTLPSGSAERSYIYHNNASNTSLHIGNQHGADAAAIHFETRNTVRASIMGSGGLTFNGDTAAANALDDYEEGTWTPSIVGTTGTAGTHAMSSSGAGNNYTKIGNRVYFQMSRYVTNKGSYTGKTAVTGLPFANNGSTTTFTLSSFPDADYPDTRMVVVQSSGTANIQFFDGAKADLGHDWSDIVTGYYLNCSGTYLTDS